MLHDNPKHHIILQILCFFVALIGAIALIVDLFIGTVLIGGAVTVFALDWLYLASDDNAND